MFVSLRVTLKRRGGDSSILITDLYFDPLNGITALLRVRKADLLFLFTFLFFLEFRPSNFEFFASESYNDFLKT